MARSLSIAARAAANSQQSGEVWAILLTISHPDLPVPIRVCDAGVDLWVGELRYQACPFNVSVPTDSEDAAPEVQLTIDNTDRRVGQAMRDLTGGRVRVDLSVVLASSPTLVEAGPYSFEVTRATVDALAVQATLAYEDLINEPYPADLISPARFTSLVA